MFMLMNMLFRYFRCKEFNVVNGTTGRVKYIRNGIVMLENSTGIIIPVFPVFTNGQSYYPLTPAYSSTVHKIMGQDLPHVTLAFEDKVLPAAVGYVGLTRVRNLGCIVPMLKLKRKHFINE